MLYGKQVKLSTTKLRQNKEKSKKADFLNDNNEYPCILKGNQIQSTVFRSTGATLCAMAVMFGEINTISFDHEHATSSTTKFRGKWKGE